eukprot:Partr_v1_DN26077_c1_g1_i2_m676 putative inositol hexakisphosphate kinase
MDSDNLLVDIRPFDRQVAGHQALMVGTRAHDGLRVIIKPTTRQEVEFYKIMCAISHPFCKWMPTFYGCSSKIHGESVLLEDITANMSVFGIADLKIGTRHYDEDASESKRTKMIRQARETTTLRFGLRITGLQLFADGHTHRNKQFYKSLHDIDDLSRHLRPLLEAISDLDSLMSDISELQKLDLSTMRLFSSSLLLVVDSRGSYKLRWLDFAHSRYSYDSESGGMSSEDERGIFLGLKSFASIIGRLRNSSI